MEIIITKNVLNHRYNEQYWCAKLQFSKSDRHFNPYRMNWLPTDEELMAIIKAMYGISPTFRDKMNREFGIKIKQEGISQTKITGWSHEQKTRL